MVTLDRVSKGRDNNLNLIRLLAATAVLVSHAWPITGGIGTPEPLLGATGRTLGTHAVLVFFALSGFLISASYHRTPDPHHFLARRARRILPGLLVALLLTAFVLGPMTSSLPTLAYLGHREVWVFLGWNGAMLGLAPQLPGVFQDNPLPAVAGSIWTLHYEVLCYLAVLGLGMVRILTNRAWAIALVGLLAALNVATQEVALHPRLGHLLDLALPFSMGVACFAWRDRIVLSPLWLCAAAGLAWMMAGTAVSEITSVVALVYAVFLVGYLPRLLVPVRFAADYSYGLYVYAFPVQGLIVFVYGPMGPLANIALALPVTLIFAALSWHCVERPWLSAEKTGLRQRRSARPRTT